MSLSDIFSIPFLICLSICMLLIGVSSIYFYQRIAQQDHKISSMISLISSLADETEQQRLRFSGGNFNMRPQQPPQQLPTIAEEKTRLIEVSDDEYDSSDGEQNSDSDNSDNNSEEDNSEEDSDNNSDDNSEGDNSSDDEKERHDGDYGEEEEQHLHRIEKNAEDSVKNIKIDLEKLGLANDDEMNDDFDDLSDIETDEREEVVCEDEQKGDENVTVQNNNIEIGEMEELSNVKTIHLEQPSGDEIVDFSIFKSINLEEPAKPVDFVDYKKMSITKLREIVSKQGVPDASKLKKNDILKLLGVEQ
jgi:hypothetical protein